MSTTNIPLTRLLNISEVADALNVDVRHVRRLVHERRIPFVKWGHLLRFDPSRSAPGSTRTDAALARDRSRQLRRSEGRR